MNEPVILRDAMASLFADWTERLDTRDAALNARDKTIDVLGETIDAQFERIHDLSRKTQRHIDEVRDMRRDIRIAA